MTGDDKTMYGNYLANIIIREIEYEDLKRGFLKVLENLVLPDLDQYSANKILSKIKSNSLHKIFVAVDKSNNDLVVGTTTLLIEPKFINKGIKIAYIEDVSVREEYQKLGIGSDLVRFATKKATSEEDCKKVILYCAKQTVSFYKKLGYKVEEDTFVMKFEAGT
jgi:glucosamine-phosphate N-acetyltransferase